MSSVIFYSGHMMEIWLWKFCFVYSESLETQSLTHCIYSWTMLVTKIKIATFLDFVPFWWKRKFLERFVPSSSCCLHLASFITTCHSCLQIRVNFLPVGHTHEDVDQFFSRVGARLRRVGAETLLGKKYPTADKSYSMYVSLHSASLVSQLSIQK